MPSVPRRSAYHERMPRFQRRRRPPGQRPADQVCDPWWTVDASDQTSQAVYWRRRPLANAGGLAKTLAFLNDKGIVVSVLDQVPDFPLEIRSCVERNVYFGRDFKTCATQPAAPFVLRHRVLTDYFGFLQKHYSFYHVASTARLFCNSEVCRAYDGETLLMQDTHHLTEAGALRSIPYLKIPRWPGPAKSTMPRLRERRPPRVFAGRRLAALAAVADVICGYRPCTRGKRQARQG